MENNCDTIVRPLITIEDYKRRIVSESRSGRHETTKNILVEYSNSNCLDEDYKRLVEVKKQIALLLRDRTPVEKSLIMDVLHHLCDCIQMGNIKLFLDPGEEFINYE